MAKAKKNQAVEDQVEGTEGVAGDEITDADVTTEAVPPVVARLCKGTMPSPLVWFIKYHESKENKSEVAKKYFTTPGKIADIQGDANQKYIVEGMKWSKEELDAARAKVNENFVRGQAEEAAKPGSVTKRGLATTQAGDEAYSLAVLDQIEAMMAGEGVNGVSLEEARGTYNAANPRAPRAKKAGDEGVDGTDEASDDVVGDDSDLDGLLDD
jgi:hypothetical protein